MEIPITISIQGKRNELERELFGLGKQVTDPEFVKQFGEGHHYTNTSVTISDGITLDNNTNQICYQASVQQWFDCNVVLFIADKLLSIGGNSVVIADWLWNRLKSRQIKIELNGKEITTKDEFQKTLDEYIKSN